MTSIQVANAPCSWGALEFDASDGELLAGTSPDCHQVLDELRRSGYSATELGDWGFMPTEPSDLRELLARYQLPVLGAFVPVALADAANHEAGVACALRVARLLAAVNDEAFIVLADDNGSDPERTRCAGRITAEHALDEQRWAVFAAGAERIAKAVRDETGLRTAFHFHCGGFVETPAEVDVLMQRTDPQLLGLCFDTGHYAYGGGDPIEGLRKHAERVWHVHFKDCHQEVASQARRDGWDYFEAVGRGVFCELGRGEVDFGGILAQLQKMDYSGWIVVEQDVLPGMGTPFESACRNRKFLGTLGL